jgi:metallophosphoesterase (TIGR00282 family)
VGSVGRTALKQVLPYLKNKFNPHFIIANGENAAGGKGITQKIANEFFDWGIQGITLGNHTWANKDIFDFIDLEDRMIRPANFPEGNPGKGYTIIQSAGKELAVVNLQGRTFLPPIDCPFTKVDQILDEIKKPNLSILIDFHAEATSEKIAMGWYLDGRVSAVVGTHTHVQTHDETVLPQGTAYVTDVGMVGSREGVLGVDRNVILQKFITQLPARFIQSEGKWFFHAVLIDMDENTGKSQKIQLIRQHEDQVLFD